MRASVAAALFLAACATSGIKVSDQQIAAFERGKTTYPEVIAALGEPTFQMNNGALRVASYGSSTVRTRPQTFIPFVGAFVGGADMRTSSVTFTFDRNDVLQNVSSSSSAVGSGLGPAPAGMSSAPTNQPRLAP